MREREFESICGEFEGPLRGMLRRMFRDTATVDDILQSTWLALFTSTTRDASRPVGPWLFTVAENLAINIYRSRKVREASSLSYDTQCQDGAPAAEEVASRNESADQISAIMPDLRDGDREAIELVYFRGMTYANAAEKLALPPGSLRTRIHRALTTLRCRLDEDGRMTDAA